MKTTVVVVLEIEGDPADAFAAVDRELDRGFFQDAINDEGDSTGPLKVTSVMSRAAQCNTCDRVRAVLFPPESHGVAMWTEKNVDKLGEILESLNPENES